MLRLPSFEYRRPRSVREAVEILADHGPDAMAVAGGTDVYPKMKRRQFRPKVLVGLRDLHELSGIRGDASSGWVIGGGTSLRAVASDPGIGERHAGLVEAIGSISTPVLRNMGTIGGNVCLDTRCNYYDQTLHWREAMGWCMKAPDARGWPISPEAAPEEAAVPCRVAPASPRCWAVSSTDSAPMLIALDAHIVLRGRNGERSVPACDFYRDDGMFFVEKAHDELVTEIRLPPADGVRSTYMKLRRRGAFDFPALGVAVALRQDGDGVVEWARIGLGGVGSRPFLVDEAADLMRGETLSDELLDEVADAVFKPPRPLDNTDYHLSHRKRMAPVFLKRAVRALSAGPK